MIDAEHPEDAVAEPGPDCPLCPRLAAFRERWRAAEPSWHNAPVPFFGPASAELLVVGLAPGLRGANRTGRPFTGDFAGELLYDGLIRHGFATGPYAARSDDGLVLTRAAIVNAVRCVPPENKPTPAEISTCRTFLAAAIGRLAMLRAILVLGRIAHDSTLRALALSPARYAFAHGAEHRLPSGLRLFDTYHSSRYNVNTGRLTPAMFGAVMAAVAAALG